MPGDLHEFGLGQFNGAVGTQPNLRAARPATPAAATSAPLRSRSGSAATGCTTTLCGYDNVFYVTAGHDESSTWQEFGEMLWEEREDVPAAFGPPGAADGPVLNAAGNPIPNWAPTRYVPWTLVAAAANHWPNAGGGSSTQAESSGQSVFAHEFSHLRGLPDNYNNPFGDTDRNYTGYWEMMSRGTFNGPGGTHNRWQIPNAGGSALGPHHMLHFKNRLNTATSTILAADEQVFLERNTLATQGVRRGRRCRPARPCRTTASSSGSRSTSAPAATRPARARTRATRATRSSTARTGPAATRPTGSRSVDRVGNDSYAPGHGVLLSKSRTSGTPNVWLIDPNPQDIGMIDFYRPDGTPVAVVRGDPRQLNDATFHAGTNSGSEYEYVDTFNKLHFYVVDVRGARTACSSTSLAVRRYDNGDPFVRGRHARQARRRAARRHHRRAARRAPSRSGTRGRPERRRSTTTSTALSATSSSADWKLTLPNALAAAKAGDAAVKVRRSRAPGDGDDDDDRDADGHVGERRVEDGDADVRPRGLSPRSRTS